MKEIFWGDYKLDEKEAINLIKNGSWQEKKFIFQKILQNSRNLLKDLSYFKKDDLKKLLNEYKIPNFTKEFLEKRVKIAKNFFFGEKVTIRELEWN